MHYLHVAQQQAASLGICVSCSNRHFSPLSISRWVKRAFLLILTTSTTSHVPPLVVVAAPEGHPCLRWQLPLLTAVLSHWVLTPSK